MGKQRGYPDRRGMGAQSDLISEQFVPEESYKVQQMVRVRHLLAAGMSPEQVAEMLSILLDSIQSSLAPEHPHTDE